MLRLALALLACLPLQEDAVDAQARLQGLIVSTNKLAGFHASYVMSRGEEREGLIELRYSATDRLVVVNTREDGSVVSVGITGGRMWMDSVNSDVGPMAGTVDLGDEGGIFEEALAILEESFGRLADDLALNVRFAWGVNEETDKTEFDLQLMYTRAGSSCLLGWLKTLQLAEGSLTFEDGKFVHVSERIRAEVDATSGFLERIHMVGSDGSERSLVLQSLDLEGPFAEELFERPEPDADARDISTELRAQLLGPAQVRNESLLRVDALLRGGARSWDADFESDLRRFLEAMHRPVLARNVERWSASVREGTTEFATQLSDRLKAGDDLAELEDAVAQRRAALVASLTDARAQMLAGLASVPTNSQPSDHWQDLRALEDEVLGELFDLHPAADLLENFDGETSAALGL